MDVSLWQVAVVFVVVLCSCILSGMAGGGAAFVTIPFMIALGLTPQQAIAISKFSSFGIGFGATAVFKKRAFKARKLMVSLMILAILISLLVPHIFNTLSGGTFRLIIGLIILSAIPLVLKGRYGLEARPATRSRKAVGGVLLAIVLLVQGVFSGANILVNIILISFFGLSTLDANAMKRITSIMLNIFIVGALILTTNFIVYKLAIAGLMASFIGGYIGSHLALRKGERFARYTLVFIMVISGISLLVD
jgi:uncharacterized membrane protein YfcA